MRSNSNDQQDAIQLLSDGERETLTLALLEGAGGRMDAEALDAAMETTFERAEMARIDNGMLNCILGGDVLVRCEPDGELTFIVKKEELGELLEGARSSTRGPNRESTSLRDLRATPCEPFLRSPDVTREESGPRNPTDGADTLQ